MAVTVALVGAESNRAVASIGFAFGLIGALAFQLWTGWRPLMFLWEPVIFGAASVLGATLVGYSFRSVKPAEDRRPDLDDDLF